MNQAPDGSAQLAVRLRTLRESHWPGTKLTQAQLAKAFSAESQVASATISAWESPGNGKVPAEVRLEAYARFFATERSIDGAPHLVRRVDLDPEEHERYEDLRRELSDLLPAFSTPTTAAPVHTSTSDLTLGNTFAFDDGPVTIICPDAPPATRSPLSEKNDPNFTKLQQYADLDALIEMWGHVRASNPDLDVYYRLASEVLADDLTTHVILVGGVAWNPVSRRFQEAVRQVPINQLEVPDLPSGEIFAVGTEDENVTQFYPTWDDHEHEERQLVEDVAFLARLRNPFNLRRTLTVCNGIHSRGVLGAVRCLTDKRVREANEQYLAERFPDGLFALLLRVPVVGSETVSPDLQNPDTRLYEWPATNEGT